MATKKTQKVWVYKPTPPKYSAEEKKKIIGIIRETIQKSDKLSQKVSRVDMKSNRVYLYEMVEQFVPDGAILVKPLIDDKYLEYPYARITLNDVSYTKCTVDWQRHNNQWMTLYEGTLAECIANIEEDEGWFR